MNASSDDFNAPPSWLTAENASLTPEPFNFITVVPFKVTERLAAMVRVAMVPVMMPMVVLVPTRLPPAI